MSSLRVEFEIPGSTPSVANLWEHWSKRAKRAKKQRGDALTLTRIHARGLVKALKAHGGFVLLTRRGKRRLDNDNLASALKATRDGIAEALGIDDGDKCLEWFYAQETGAPHVRVRIEEWPEGKREAAS